MAKAISNKKTIKIIAHRGASSLAPENTMAAFRKAKELGAVAVELDVHATADGKLVVHHDSALGHPDNGTGLIMEADSQYIKTVDAGGWFSPMFAGEKIPFLEEVFTEFRDTFDYEIELKGSSMNFLEQVLRLVDTYKLTRNVEFTSPHIALLCRLKQRRPESTCGVFFTAYPEWMSQKLGELTICDTMKLVPADIAHIPGAILTRSLVTLLRAEEKRIHVANCNTENEIKNAVSFGCDQFTTNDVVLAYRILGR